MARRKTEKAAPSPETEHEEGDAWGANEESERARAEAVAGDEADEAEDGEEFHADDHEDDPEADLAAVSRVDHDAGSNPEPAFMDEETGEGLMVGAALTNRQNVGIDPTSYGEHLTQASDRATLNNGQTDHERDNGLDAVSGTPNPGITQNHNHSAPGALGASDMSGGLAKADPFASSGVEVRRVMDVLGKASHKAIREGKRGQGYVDLKTLNVQKSVMDALVKGGHVTQETRPGAGFHPETGTVYRVASHQEPEHKSE